MVVPLAARRKPGRAAWLPWAATLAAALAAAIGVSTWRWWTEPPNVNSAALVEPLAARAAALTDKLHSPPVYRGEAAATPDDAKAFQLGVQLLDLRVAARARYWKRLVEVLDRIARVTRSVDFMSESGDRCADLAEEVRRDPAAQTPSRLAASADQVETDIAGWFQGNYLAFGEWTEAARLGALAGMRDAFTSRTSRRFLERLYASQEEPLDPDVLGILQRVEARAARRALRRRDLDAQAVDLESVIEHYDRLVESE